MDTQTQKKYDLIEFQNLKLSISKEVLEKFLESKNIEIEEIEMVKNENPELKNARIKILSNAMNLTKLELLKKEIILGFEDQKIHLKYLISGDSGLVIDIHPNENEVITYPFEYHNMITEDFERTLGSEELIYKNKEVIEKQRAVVGYLMKKIGANLFTGKSIMNVSLPINIFDVRSLLEVFVSQTAYAPYFLEKAGVTDDKLECIKLTTSFILNTVHLAVAQTKPFNPILGETFQANINGSSYYVEQTSHHPPIFNFLYLGQNYKVHGYNESEVSSGANSVKAKYKGKYIIEFKNGIKHFVFFPEFKLTGTLFGNRSIKYEGNMMIVDEANDLIAYITMDPDERGFLKKFFSKKKSNYPDYFKGIITSISKNAKFDKKEKSYTVNDLNKNVISNIEGEYSNHIQFDTEYYWQKKNLEHPTYKRMRFTLPSDSTFREDIVWLRKQNEDMAQKAKIKLEEIQRGDKKSRENFKKMKK